MQISRIYLNSNRFPKLKIALLADIHDRPCRDVLAALAYEKPDIITVAGDLTDKPLNPDSQALVVLRKCADIAPVFYSAGNHECMFGEKDRRLVSCAGGVLLNNEFRMCRGIYIGGLRTGFDGKSKHSSPPPETAWLADFEKLGGVKVLICHHPEYYEKYLRNRDIDLILSGHAHGGQMRFFGRGLFSPSQGFFPAYTKGSYDGRLVVSAGLANTTFIPRFNNPRDLVLIETGYTDDK